MSLSARIAIDPSRRLERLVTLFAVGGILVAASTLALRWPQFLPVVALLAMAACAAIVVWVRRHRATRVTLSVSRHPAFDVQPDPVESDGPWCLAESTVVWPGFAMVAMRHADASVTARVVRVPVVSGELDPADRRSLGRFLIWSLHHGIGADPLSLRP